MYDICDVYDIYDIYGICDGPWFDWTPFEV
jgi:hypothetical protein